MLEAKDVMTKQVICIRKETPIFEAIELMVENSVTGIPVVEEDMTLIGILSEQDVLGLFHTDQDEKTRTVEDFMTQPAIHFEQNELLSDVCHCLKDNCIRRIPVTSNGKVVGVISRSDILECILQLSKEGAIPTGG